MSVTFKKAPLVELVVELRWNPGGIEIPSTPTPALQPAFFEQMNSSEFEEFYMRFGALAHGFGFSSAERLVPPGFPALPFQAVYRYKNSAETKELLQVGPGVFSANALQPYKSWKAFRPSVEKGIDALLQVRSEKDKKAPFFATTLRYINAFGPELLEGRHPTVFMRDVFGITAEIPREILAHGADNEPALVVVDFVLPLKNGAKLKVKTGEGNVGGGSDVLLFDLTVANERQVEPTTKAALSALDEARDIMHDIFLSRTKSVHEKMGPDTSDA